MFHKLKLKLNNGVLGALKVTFVTLIISVLILGIVISTLPANIAEAKSVIQNDLPSLSDTPESDLSLPSDTPEESDIPSNGTYSGGNPNPGFDPRTSTEKPTGDYGSRVVEFKQPDDAMPDEFGDEYHEEGCEYYKDPSVSANKSTIEPYYTISGGSGYTATQLHYTEKWNDKKGKWVTVQEGVDVYGFNLKSIYSLGGAYYPYAEPTPSHVSYGDRQYYNGTITVPFDFVADNHGSIMPYAYSNCKTMTSYTRNHVCACNPDQIISAHAFDGCTSLRSVFTISSGRIHTIDNYAFANCTSLYDITLECSQWFRSWHGTEAEYEKYAQPGITRIGDYAFYNCKSLQGFRYDYRYRDHYWKNNDSTGSNDRAGYDRNGYVVDDTTPIYYNDKNHRLKGYGRSNSEITIYPIGPLKHVPERLSSLGKGVFRGCSSLQSWFAQEILDKRTSSWVQDELFQDCTSLTKIVIPSGYSGIGNNAFKGCTNLREVYIPASVSSIGEGAFEGCTNLRIVRYGGDGSTTDYFSNSNGACRYIGARAFANCPNLFNGTNMSTNLVVPPNTYYIGDYAFAHTVNASNLATTGISPVTEITLPAGLSTLGSGAFYGLVNVAELNFNCTSRSLNLPENNKTFYDLGKNVSDGVKLKLSGVTRIGDYMFNPCNDPTYSPNIKTVGNITGMSDLTAIGRYAFAYCDWFETLAPPDSQNIETYEEGAFYNCMKLKTADLGTAVVTIGDKAFEGCVSLSSVTTGAGTQTIGSRAFFNCSELTEFINLDDSGYGKYKYIKESAFEKCSKLPEIYISAELVELGKRAFADCTLLEDIHYCENFTDTGVLETIGEEAFINCESLSIIYIPISIRLSKLNSFKNCVSLRLVRYYGTQTQWTSLITFENGYANPLSGYQFDAVLRPDRQEFCVQGVWNDILTIYDSGTTTKINDYSFFGCSGISSINVTKSTATVGKYAFAYCTDLKTALFYGGTDGVLKSFSESMFEGCSSITSISVPLSVETIETHCFRYCSGLQNVIIPDTIKTLEDGVFHDCSNIKEMRLPFIGRTREKPEEGKGYEGVLGYIFGYTTEPERNEDGDVIDNTVNQYTAPDGTAYYYYLPTEITTIAISDGNVTTIDGKQDKWVPDYGFRNVRIKRLEFPNDIKKFGAYAFAGCTTLTDILVPIELKYIDKYAFCDCVSIARFDIPLAVTRIEEGTFKGCTMFTRTGLHEDVTYIGSYAYQGCTSLVEITVYEKVKRLGKKAFADCTALERIYYNANNCRQSSETTPPDADSVTVPEDGPFFESGKTIEADGTEQYMCTLNIGVNVSGVYAYAFSYLKASQVTYYGHSNCKEIGAYAFYKSKIVQVTNIPSQLTVIGESAFEECSRLESFAFPITVKTISRRAFYHCALLTEIIIPEPVIEINEYAFAECERLEQIYFNAAEVQVSASNIFYNSGSLEGHAQGILLTVGNTVTLIPEKLFHTDDEAREAGKEPKLRKVIFEDGSVCRRILPYAFANCIKLDVFETANTITSIGNYAFYYCKNLQEIEIPGGTTQINRYTFAYSGLTNVVVPEGVTDILDYAFYNCASVKDIVLPESLVRLSGSHMFQYCASLQSIAIPVGVGEIGFDTSAISQSGKTAYGGLLFGCNSLKELTMPFIGKNPDSSKGIESVLGYTFGYSDDSDSNVKQEYFTLEKTTAYKYFYIPQTLEHVTILRGNNAGVPKYAFNNCTMIKRITLNDGIVQIGDYACLGCLGLEQVDIPKSVRIFGINSFKNCREAENTVRAGIKVNYGGSLKQWFDIDFKNEFAAPMRERGQLYIDGEKVVNMTVPNEITSIKPFVFLGCDFSTSSGGGGDITIHVSVTDIKEKAFYSCTGIKTLYFNPKTCNVEQEAEEITETDKEYIEADDLQVFFGSGNKERNTTLVVGPDVGYIAKYMFHGAYFKTVLFSSESCKSIGMWAFADNPFLTYCEFPASITRVSVKAFYRCNSDTDVHYSGNVVQWVDIDFATSHDNKGVEDDEKQEGGFSNPLWYGGNLFTLAVMTGASQGTKLEELTADGSLSHIKAYAFAGCSSLKRVKLNRGVVYVGDQAFFGCENLSEVTISETVVTLCKRVFGNCQALEKLDVDGSNPVYTSKAQYANSVTYKGDDLTTEESIPLGGNFDAIVVKETKELIIGCKSTLIPNDGTVKTIGKYAFEFIETLRSMYVSDAVIEISEYAFYGCTGLITLTIGTGMREIENFAFYNCSGLRKIYFNAINCVDFTENNYIFYGAGNKYATPELDFEVGTLVENIPAYVFNPVAVNNSEFAPKVTSVTLPDSAAGAGNCKRIGEYAFAYCDALKTVMLPNSIHTIGVHAFDSCVKLESVTLPTDLMAISDYTFYNCESLGFVHLESNVKSIGVSAFQGCKSLVSSKLVFASGIDIEFIGRYAFTDSGIYAPSNWSDGMLVFDKYVIEAKQTVEEFSCSNEITLIASHAFYNCANLKEINYGQSLKYINSHAFDGCILLGTGDVVSETRPITESSDFSSTALRDIGDYAFNGCININGVKFPAAPDGQSTVRSIGSYAFLGCDNSNFNTISLPRSVERIGEGALAILNLEYAELPFVGGSVSAAEASESTLFGYVFGKVEATGFTEIEQSYALDGEKIKFFVPDTFKRVKLIDPWEYNAGNSEKFGGAQNLYFGAFANFAALEEITLPDTALVNIHEYAFANCSGLTELTVNNSVMQIKNFAFYDCTSLNKISLPFVGTSDNAQDQEALFGYVFGYTETPDPTKSYTEQVYGWDSVADDHKRAAYYIPDSLKTVIITRGRGDSSIYYGSFSYCTKLNSITYAEGVNITGIGRYAFYNASGLKAYTINEETTQIGQYAFYGTRSLENLYYNARKVNYSDPADTFYKADNNVFTYAGRPSPDTTDSLTVTIGNTVEYIPDNLFNPQNGGNSPKIGSLLFEENSKLYYIGKNAFLGCADFPVAYLPDTVRVIGDKAFYGCKNLSWIYMPTLQIAAPAPVSGFSKLFTSAYAASSGAVTYATLTIGENAFVNCNTGMVLIAANVSEYNNYSNNYYLFSASNKVYFNKTAEDKSRSNQYDLSYTLNATFWVVEYDRAYNEWVQEHTENLRLFEQSVYLNQNADFTWSNSGLPNVIEYYKVTSWRDSLLPVEGSFNLLDENTKVVTNKPLYRVEDITKDITKPDLEYAELESYKFTDANQVYYYGHEYEVVITPVATPGTLTDTVEEQIGTEEAPKTKIKNVYKAYSGIYSGDDHGVDMYNSVYDSVSLDAGKFVGETFSELLNLKGEAHPYTPNRSIFTISHIKYTARDGKYNESGEDTVIYDKEFSYNNEHYLPTDTACELGEFLSHNNLTNAGTYEFTLSIIQKYWRLKYRWADDAYNFESSDPDNIPVDNKCIVRVEVTPKLVEFNEIPVRDTKEFDGTTKADPIDFNREALNGVVGKDMLYVYLKAEADYADALAGTNKKITLQVSLTNENDESIYETNIHDSDQYGVDMRRLYFYNYYLETNVTDNFSITHVKEQNNGVIKPRPVTFAWNVNSALEEGSPNNYDANSVWSLSPAGILETVYNGRRRIPDGTVTNAVEGFPVAIESMSYKQTVTNELSEEIEVECDCIRTNDSTHGLYKGVPTLTDNNNYCYDASRGGTYSIPQIKINPSELNFDPVIILYNSANPKKEIARGTAAELTDMVLPNGEKVVLYESSTLNDNAVLIFPALDNNNPQIALRDESGAMYAINERGDEITVALDGTVKDKNGDKIGTSDADGNISYIIKVDDSGNIKDYKNEVIGKEVDGKRYFIITREDGGEQILVNDCLGTNIGVIVEEEVDGGGTVENVQNGLGNTIGTISTTVTVNGKQTMSFAEGYGLLGHVKQTYLKGKFEWENGDEKLKASAEGSKNTYNWKFTLDSEYERDFNPIGGAGGTYVIEGTLDIEVRKVQISKLDYVEQLLDTKYPDEVYAIYTADMFKEMIDVSGYNNDGTDAFGGVVLDNNPNCKFTAEDGSQNLLVGTNKIIVTYEDEVELSYISGHKLVMEIEVNALPYELKIPEAQSKTYNGTEHSYVISGGVDGTINLKDVPFEEGGSGPVYVNSLGHIVGDLNGNAYSVDVAASMLGNKYKNVRAELNAASGNVEVLKDEDGNLIGYDVYLKISDVGGNTRYTATDNNGNYYYKWAGMPQEERSVKVSFVVNPLEVTISGVSADDKVYDGTVSTKNGETSIVKVSTTSLGGTVAGDEINFTITDSAFDNPNVGTRNIVATISLDGAAANNYILKGNEGTYEFTGKIIPKPIKLEWSKDGSGSPFEFTYNGKDQKPTVKIVAGQMVTNFGGIDPKEDTCDVSLEEVETKYANYDREPIYSIAVNLSNANYTFAPMSEYEPNYVVTENSETGVNTAKVEFKINKLLLTEGPKVIIDSLVSKPDLSGNKLYAGISTLRQVQLKLADEYCIDGVPIMNVAYQFTGNLDQALPAAEDAIYKCTYSLVDGLAQRNCAGYGDGITSLDIHLTVYNKVDKPADQSFTFDGKVHSYYIDDKALYGWTYGEDYQPNLFIDANLEGHEVLLKIRDGFKNTYAWGPGLDVDKNGILHVKYVGYPIDCPPFTPDLQFIGTADPKEIYTSSTLENNALLSVPDSFIQNDIIKQYVQTRRTKMGETGYNVYPDSICTFEWVAGQTLTCENHSYKYVAKFTNQWANNFIAWTTYALVDMDVTPVVPKKLTAVNNNPDRVYPSNGLEGLKDMLTVYLHYNDGSTRPAPLAKNEYKLSLSSGGTLVSGDIGSFENDVLVEYVGDESVESTTVKVRVKYTVINAPERHIVITYDGQKHIYPISGYADDAQTILASNAYFLCDSAGKEYIYGNGIFGPYDNRPYVKDANSIGADGEYGYYSFYLKTKTGYAWPISADPTGSGIIEVRLTIKKAALDFVPKVILIDTPHLFVGNDLNVNTRLALPDYLYYISGSFAWTGNTSITSTASGLKYKWRFDLAPVHHKNFTATYIETDIELKAYYPLYLPNERTQTISYNPNVKNQYDPLKITNTTVISNEFGDQPYAYKDLLDLYSRDTFYTDAGKYEFWLKITDDNFAWNTSEEIAINGMSVGVVPVWLDIKPAVITSNIVIEDKVYDGSIYTGDNLKYTYTVTYSDETLNNRQLESRDAYSPWLSVTGEYLDSYSGAYDAKNVGSKSVKVKVKIKDDYNSNGLKNYVLKDNTSTFIFNNCKIVPKEIELDWSDMKFDKDDAVSKDVGSETDSLKDGDNGVIYFVYDGEAHRPIAKAKGLVGKDVCVPLTHSDPYIYVNQNINDANSIVYYEATVTLSNNNYTLSEKDSTVKFKIIRAKLKFEPTVKIIDENNNEYYRLYRNNPLSYVKLGTPAKGGYEGAFEWMESDASTYVFETHGNHTVHWKYTLTEEIKPNFLTSEFESNTELTAYIAIKVPEDKVVEYNRQYHEYSLDPADAASARFYYDKDRTALGTPSVSYQLNLYAGEDLTNPYYPPTHNNHRAIGNYDHYVRYNITSANDDTAYYAWAPYSYGGRLTTETVFTSARPTDTAVYATVQLQITKIKLDDEVNTYLVYETVGTEMADTLYYTDNLYDNTKLYLDLYQAGKEYPTDGFTADEIAWYNYDKAKWLWDIDKAAWESTHIESEPFVVPEPDVSTKPALDLTLGARSLAFEKYYVLRTGTVGWDTDPYQELVYVDNPLITDYEHKHGYKWTFNPAPEFASTYDDVKDTKELGVKKVEINRIEITFKTDLDESTTNVLDVYSKYTLKELKDMIVVSAYENTADEDPVGVLDNDKFTLSGADYSAETNRLKYIETGDLQTITVTHERPGGGEIQKTFYIKVLSTPVDKPKDQEYEYWYQTSHSYKYDTESGYNIIDEQSYSEVGEYPIQIGLRWGYRWSDPTMTEFYIAKLTIKKAVLKLEASCTITGTNAANTLYVSSSIYDNVSIGVSHDYDSALSKNEEALMVISNGDIRWNEGQTLSAGTAEYNWTFTPSSEYYKNYEIVVGTYELNATALKEVGFKAVLYSTDIIYSTNRVPNLKDWIRVNQLLNSGELGAEIPYGDGGYTLKGPDKKDPGLLKIGKNKITVTYKTYSPQVIEVTVVDGTISSGLAILVPDAQVVVYDRKPHSFVATSAHYQIIGTNEFTAANESGYDITLKLHDGYYWATLDDLGLPQPVLPQNTTITVKFIIEKAELTVEGVYATPKTYDGNRTVHPSNLFYYQGPAYLKGVYTGDYVSYTVTGVYDDKNAGTGKEIYLTYTLTGEGSENYKVAESSKTIYGNINPKELTQINWASLELVYNGLVQRPYGVIPSSDLIGSDTCNVVVADGYETVGTYTSSVSLDNSNYVLVASKRSITYKIIPASLRDINPVVEITAPARMLYVDLHNLNYARLVLPRTHYGYTGTFYWVETEWLGSKVFSMEELGINTFNWMFVPDEEYKSNFNYSSLSVPVLDSEGRPTTITRDCVVDLADDKVTVTATQKPASVVVWCGVATPVRSVKTVYNGEIQYFEERFAPDYVPEEGDECKYAVKAGSTAGFVHSGSHTIYLVIKDEYKSQFYTWEQAAWVREDVTSDGVLSVKFKIDKAPVDIHGFTVLEKIYDGTKDASIDMSGKQFTVYKADGTTREGLYGTDSLDKLLRYYATFDSVHASDKRIVSVHFELKENKPIRPSGRPGAYDPTPCDYEIPDSFSVKIIENCSILPRPIDVAWGESVFTYNASPQMPEAYVLDCIEGDVCYALVRTTEEAINASPTPYVAQAYALSNPDYTLNGAQEREFLIIKATPLFNPIITITGTKNSQLYTTSNIYMNADLSVPKEIGFKNSDAMLHVAGKLEWAKGQVLLAGKHAYRWQFVPEDKDNFENAISLSYLTVIPIFVDSMTVSVTSPRTLYITNSLSDVRSVITVLLYNNDGELKGPTTEYDLSSATGANGLTRGVNTLTATYRVNPDVYCDFDITVYDRSTFKPITVPANQTVTYDGATHSFSLVEGLEGEGIHYSILSDNEYVSANEEGYSIRLKVEQGYYWYGYDREIEEVIVKLIILKADFNPEVFVTIKGSNPDSPYSLYTSSDIYTNTELTTTGGTVSWAANQLLIAGEHDYYYTFIPEDSENYKVTKGKFTLVVESVELKGLMVELASQELIYTTDSLGDLKNWLNVFALYTDGTHAKVKDYTLSSNASQNAAVSPNALLAGVNNIKVTYNEVSADTAVNVLEVKTNYVVIIIIAVVALLLILLILAAFIIIWRLSFKFKLNHSNNATRVNCRELENAFMVSEGVESEVNYSNESFTIDGKVIGYLTFKGKQLCVAINAPDYLSAQYADIMGTEHYKKANTLSEVASAEVAKVFDEIIKKVTSEKLYEQAIAQEAEVAAELGDSANTDSADSDSEE